MGGFVNYPLNEPRYYQILSIDDHWSRHIFKVFSLLGVKIWSCVRIEVHHLDFKEFDQHLWEKVFWAFYQHFKMRSKNKAVESKNDPQKFLRSINAVLEQ